MADIFINGMLIKHVDNMHLRYRILCTNCLLYTSNPKLIYINTSETVISLEDSILTVFLHLMGFDIVFFVPTGYQSIEKYFNGQLMDCLLYTSQNR